MVGLLLGSQVTPVGYLLITFNHLHMDLHALGYQLPLKVLHLQHF